MRLSDFFKLRKSALLAGIGRDEYVDMINKNSAKVPHKNKKNKIFGLIKMESEIISRIVSEELLVKSYDLPRSLRREHITSMLAQQVRVFGKDRGKVDPTDGFGLYETSAGPVLVNDGVASSLKLNAYKGEVPCLLKSILDVLS